MANATHAWSKNLIAKMAHSGGTLFMGTRRVLTVAAVVLAVGGIAVYLTTTVEGQSTEFANFEGSQTNPIRLSADGTRLFAVNTANASLSVFDVSNPAAPALIREIPVGLEPVSVNPRTNDEAWVVNQLSDSVSIVSVSRGIVVATLSSRRRAHGRGLRRCEPGVRERVPQQCDRGLRYQHAGHDARAAVVRREPSRTGGQSGWQRASTRPSRSRAMRRR